MNATNDNQDGPEDLLALVPFYVNDTLEGEDKARIEAALKTDPEIAGEIAFWEDVVQNVVAEHADQSLNSPGEIGLKRLQRDITKSKNSANGSWRARAQSGAIWKPSLIAACLALFVGYGAGVILPLKNAEYKSAGGDSITSAKMDAPVLTIRFTDDASAARIEEIMRQEQLTIVAGPSALGLYRVRTDLTPDNQDGLATLIVRLGANPSVIAHVSRNE